MWLLDPGHCFDPCMYDYIVLLYIDNKFLKYQHTLLRDLKQAREDLPII